MPGPRLKAPKSNGSAPPEAGAKPIPLPALNISGVVVKKNDLVEALRVYVPLLADIEAFEDGEHFYLIFDGQRVKEEAGELA